MATATASSKIGDFEYDDRTKQEGKITVQEKIEERRKFAYLLDLKGYSNSYIASKLAVSESTIVKDLRFMRNDWKMRFMQLEISGYVHAFLDAKEHLELVTRELWQLYDVEENSKIKVNILNSISQIALERKELMQTKPDLYEDVLKVPGVIH